VFKLAVNTAEPADEPVDPAAGQNHSDSSGRDIDEFRFSQYRSFGNRTGKPLLRSAFTPLHPMLFIPDSEMLVALLNSQSFHLRVPVEGSYLLFTQAMT